MVKRCVETTLAKGIALGWGRSHAVHWWVDKWGNGGAGLLAGVRPRVGTVKFWKDWTGYKISIFWLIP